MQRFLVKAAASLAIISCAVLSLGLTGCQSTVGGQTLPSAFYLTDDVQYFPAGPEFLLPNQVQALEEYRSEQEGADGGLGQVP
jgi:hypothetical protein